VATAASVEDFLAFGLHPDALAAALAQVSRVTHVGAGAGVMTVHESSAPLGVYDVRVQVVASGAPGAATVQWTINAGVTWAGPVVAPAGGAPLVLGATGLAVAFDGALVAGDLYTFAAVRALERHLAAANARMAARLRRRYPGGLPSWDDGILSAVVADAALSVLTMRGFDPKNGADKAVELRAKTGAEYVDDVLAARVHPEGAETNFDVAPAAFSEPRRED
jgi:hypothetical protein